MKKLAIFCLVLGLQGLNSFGQTNAVPSKAHPAPKPKPEAQKEPAKQENTEAAPVVPEWVDLNYRPAHKRGILQAFREGNQQHKTKVAGEYYSKNSETALELVFRWPNDQAGATSIRDAVVPLFPSGR